MAYTVPQIRRVVVGCADHRDFLYVEYVLGTIFGLNYVTEAKSVKDFFEKSNECAGQVVLYICHHYIASLEDYQLLRAMAACERLHPIPLVVVTPAEDTIEPIPENLWKDLCRSGVGFRAAPLKRCGADMLALAIGAFVEPV